MRQSHSVRRFELTDTARAAVKAFRDAKPWRGTEQERLDKFAEFHRGMCRAYDLETMLYRDDRSADPNGTSGGSYIDFRTNKIVQTGRLSVVTYLFLFASACGADRAAAMAKAVEIFAHFFPRSFRRCRMVGGLLVQVEARAEAS